MGREAVLLWYEDGGDVVPLGFPTLLHLVGDGAIRVGVELVDSAALLKAAKVVGFERIRTWRRRRRGGSRVRQVGDMWTARK